MKFKCMFREKLEAGEQTSIQKVLVTSISMISAHYEELIYVRTKFYTHHPIIDGMILGNSIRMEFGATVARCTY